MRVDLMQVMPWGVHCPAALRAGHVIWLVVADLLRYVHKLIALAHRAIVPAKCTVTIAIHEMRSKDREQHVPCKAGATVRAVTEAN